MLDKNQLYAYFDAHEHEFFADFAELCAIPAPSHHEEKRALWVKEKLVSWGIEGAEIDDALNVVLPVGNADNLEIFMAHTDVVFPDTDALPVEIADGILHAPGCGDDTANLIVMLWVIRWLKEMNAVPKGMVVFCANSCEEGLGNLKGCRKLHDTYSGRINSLVTFDGSLGGIVNSAVGSQRYKVTVKTEGGHSYGAFGNKNAIAELAEMITALYQIHVPPYGKTTYNVGGIEGGTSVNTIAQECHMLYEFRSDDRRGLRYMENAFRAVCDAWRARGVDVEVEILGVRPCSGDVDENALSALVRDVNDAQKQITGKECTLRSGSTDANIPLSLGIPAVCCGVSRGAGTHTREEWVEMAALRDGFAFAAVLISERFIV